MMKLLLLRHAQSLGNASGVYAIAESGALSELGERQASRLAENLAAWRIDTVLASPLQRAQDTISPYLSATGRHAEVWPEIAEGCWHEGREDPSDSWRSIPAPVAAASPGLFFFRNSEAVRPVDSQTFGEGLLRVHETMARLEAMAAQADSLVLMVTHGHFIREILNRMLRPRSLEPFPHVNCGATLLTYRKEWTMDFGNRPLGNA